jgi:hypothetical protein
METMKMTVRGQIFAWAVRQEMGWPLFKPANDCIAFSAGRMMDIEVAMESARIAQTIRKDMIHLSWLHPNDTEPTTFAVIIRELLQVDIIDRCVPWAADETSPLTLVSTRGDECFAMGPRGMLERFSGKPKKLLAGRNLAMRRIRAAAKKMPHELAQDTLWVPEGADVKEPYVDLETVVTFH